MIEFLDNETIQPFQPKIPVWQQNNPDAFLLDTELVHRLSQPGRLQEILLKDRGIIEDLKTKVANTGFTHPLILKLDTHSKIVLYDGHHRLIVALERKIEAIPVKLEQCESLSLKTVPVLEALKWILTSGNSKK